jgi:hypothetical protein
VAAGRGIIEDNGTVRSTAVPAGKYFIRVGSLPQGWALKAVNFGGQDVSDVPMEVDRDAELVILLTDEPSRLSGLVSSKNAPRVPEASVVVFPADSRLWVDYGINPRRLRSTRVGPSGEFAVIGLPAGDYFVAAITETDLEDWRDPQKLRKVSARATRIALKEGESVIKNIQIDPAQDPLTLHEQSQDREIVRGPSVVGEAGPIAGSSLTQDDETSSLAGLLVTGTGGGDPVAGATLTLSGPGLREGRESISNDQGQFQFARLPAGSFVLRASKPGFVSAAYGARPPASDLGTPITLGSGQSATVQFRILRGAAIEGRCLTAAGRPMPRTVVRAIQSYTRGPRRLLSEAIRAPALTAVTDDRGFYRISDVGPGEYLVVAMPSSSTMPPIGNISSAVWSDAPRRAYVPIYYPGVTNSTEAAVLELLEGDNRSSIDFVATTAPTTRVDLRVSGPNGQTPFLLQVLVFPTFLPAAVRPLVQLPAAKPSGDGTFTIVDLIPGRYLISARGASTPDSGRTTSLNRSEVPQARTLSGAVSLTVDGEQAIGLQLTLDEGVNVSGQVVFGDGSQQIPSDFETVLVTLERVIVEDRDPPPPVPQVRPGPDGSFVLAGVAPGQYRLVANSSLLTSSGQAWFLEGSLLDGRDTRDVPIEVPPHTNVSGAVLRLIDHPAQISGTLRDSSGRPTSDGYVLAFPSQEIFWRRDSPRFPKPARPATNGHFVVGGLPSGEYVVATMVDINPTDWFDVTLLRRLQATSRIRIVIGSGDAKTVDLVADRR